MIGAASELGVVGSLISLDKLVWAPGNSVGGYYETSEFRNNLGYGRSTDCNGLSRT